jgi:hypothetical protein
LATFVVNGEIVDEVMEDDFVWLWDIFI